MKDAKVDRAVRSLSSVTQRPPAPAADVIAVARQGERAVERALRLARGGRFQHLYRFVIGQQRES